MTRQNCNEVYRHELKYYINERDAHFLAQYFSLLMKADVHGDHEGKYWIRSLYFDTPGNRDYYDKINGYSERRKLRLRIYSTTSNTAHLELKLKNGAYIHKKSIPLSKENAEKLITGDYKFLSKLSNGSQTFYACFCHGFLMPILLIDYERQAFELPFENIRITIDRNLMASKNTRQLFDEDNPKTKIVGKASCILEVKFQHAFPEFLRTILSEIDTTGTSISKYIICRQSINY